MKPGAFIFVLWSDSLRWERYVLPDLRTGRISVPKIGTGISGHAIIRKLGGIVYCVDENARQAAELLDLPYKMLVDNRSYEAAWHTTEARILPGDQFVRKFLALRDALTKHPDAVLLDIDMILMRSLPQNYWEQLRAGADIQAPLTRLKRRKSKWRPLEESGDTLPQHFSINASCVYARSVPVVERAIAIMEDNPGWYEEHALAYLIDELMGGWKGEKEYDELGYQPPGVSLYKGYHNADDPWFLHLRR